MTIAEALRAARERLHSGANMAYSGRDSFICHAIAGATGGGYGNASEHEAAQFLKEHLGLTLDGDYFENVLEASGWRSGPNNEPQEHVQCQAMRLQMLTCGIHLAEKMGV
jgi:hypothetical protein